MLPLHTQWKYLIIKNEHLLLHLLHSETAPLFMRPQEWWTEEQLALDWGQAHSQIWLTDQKEKSCLYPRTQALGGSLGMRLSHLEQVWKQVCLWHYEMRVDGSEAGLYHLHSKFNLSSLKQQGPQKLIPDGEFSPQHTGADARPLSSPLYSLLWGLCHRLGEEGRRLD